MKPINTRKLFKAREDLRRARLFKEGIREATEEYSKALAPLQAAIVEAEGRAKARTIDAEDIMDALRAVEDKLSIPKKYLEGVEVCIDVNGQKFPRAYKYTPDSTWFNAVYKSGSWRVVCIQRNTTAGENDGYRVELTEDAEDAILARHTRF